MNTNTLPAADWPEHIGAPLWLFFILLLYVHKDSGGLIITESDLADISAMPEDIAKKAVEQLVDLGYIQTQDLDPYLRLEVLHWGIEQAEDNAKAALRRPLKMRDEFYIGSA